MISPLQVDYGRCTRRVLAAEWNVSFKVDLKHNCNSAISILAIDLKFIEYLQGQLKYKLFELSHSSESSDECK